MDLSGFSLHIAACQDDSFSVLISLDGFESEEAAGDFAHLFLMDGSIAVGDIELAANGMELSLH
jgi:hypothetical protein